MFFGGCADLVFLRHTVVFLEMCSQKYKVKRIKKQFFKYIFLSAIMLKTRRYPYKQRELTCTLCEDSMPVIDRLFLEDTVYSAIIVEVPRRFF